MLLYGGWGESESFVSQTGKANIAPCITPPQCHQTQSVEWLIESDYQDRLPTVVKQILLVSF